MEHGMCKCKDFDPLVSRKELRTIYGIPLSYTQLMRKMFPDDGSEPSFPMWVKLGKHPNSRVAWRRSHILEWLENPH